jgi:hypothetical protein
MRWVLPGGATLGGSNRGDDEQRVACRPLAAVLERTCPRKAAPTIFISYRRDDSEAMTGRIDDWLARHFGRERVFVDVDSIPLGVDFRKHLEQAVGRSGVLLAIIGQQWLDIRYEAGPKQGQRRLDDPADFVRIEIQAALTRDIPVIPVLVGKATMPREEDLPEGLRPLVYRNAAEVRPGLDFRVHVARLIDGIERAFSR